MSLVLIAIGLLVASALAAFLLARAPRLATLCGVGGAMLAGLAGLIPSLRILLTGANESFVMPWSMPGGSLHIGLDAVSAVFLIPIFLITALAALYGGSYLRPFWGKRAIGFSWFCFNLLTACLILVVVARNGLLFLMAWEGMSLASFFLVVFEHDKKEAREAGWLYLVATHLGAAFLLIFFALLAREAHSFDFDCIGAMPQTIANAAFLLAVIGFGTKAGFMPLHVWLPEAHPAAPSHVSAVLSGIMIKTGIYGLVRTLILLGNPPVWWGWTLVGIGLSSGILGVVYALAQHDLKRLLAYCSVENIGIIALGLGLGVLGLSMGHPLVAQLGFGGALLHVVNHALFKGLLFLGAGAVAHSTGTRDMDRLGGLAKIMPWTALTFIIGSAAIAGLPPLNGFVGEFLVYYGALIACLPGGMANPLPAVGIVAGLALIGGLAAACFAKAFGIVFLGEPRTDAARQAHECGWSMRLPMIILAAACVLIGFGAPWAVAALKPAIADLAGVPAAQVFSATGRSMMLLMEVTIGFAAAAGVVVLLGFIRRRLLKNRTVRFAPTWGCGYAAPTPRMQYTGSSFALWFVDAFRWILRTERHRSLPQGYFPDAAFMTTETPDGFRELIFRPVFAQIRWALASLRWIQHGRLQVYILYIAATLVALLIWYASCL